jgi:hypothetical protein
MIPAMIARVTMIIARIDKFRISFCCIRMNITSIIKAITTMKKPFRICKNNSNPVVSNKIAVGSVGEIKGDIKRFVTIPI